MGLSARIPRRAPRVSVLRLEGVVAARGRGGGSLSHKSLATAIERSFTRGRPAAVALVVNSPGGSPAQSALIARDIRRRADETSIPVHAFVEDLAASGGYYIASAADHIWVDETSLIGSIGVVSAGFGFSDLIARYGVERRVHTAGRSKSMLDPFQPEKEADVANLRAILDQVHHTFIEHVRARRGARLSDAEALFEGDVWAGRRAVELGLADGVADLTGKMQALFGARVRMTERSPRAGLRQRLGIGALSDSVADTMEERLLWQRFGL